jgi:hypothetical protein
MSFQGTVTGEQLANALHALGVNFIMGGNYEKTPLQNRPARLIAALAESSEARLRLSLIPLFLEHPEFARHVRGAAGKTTPSARLTLQCYYSAAVWLYRKIRPGTSLLPDIFSEELNLSTSDDPDENLQRLAKRHQEISGTRVNWLGTYYHGAQGRIQKSARI